MAEIPAKFQDRFIDIEVQGVKNAQELLFDYSGYLLDAVGPLEASRGILAAGIARRFRQQSDPQGDAWEPWSESYAPKALREQESGIHKGEILERSLDLRTQATTEYSFHVSADSVFFSFDGLPDYAAVQNFGGSVGKGAVLPQRQFVGTDDDDEQRIYAVFQQWVDYSLRISGSGRGALGRFVSLQGLPSDTI